MHPFGPLDSLQSFLVSEAKESAAASRSSKTWRRSGMVVPAGALHNCRHEGNSSQFTGE